MNSLSKIEQAETNLQRKLDWLGRHDTRVAFVAGIAIAMLGVLANATAIVTDWKWFLYLIFAATSLLLFISLVYVYLSQYPVTKSQNSSLLYFGTISQLKVDEFKKRFKQLTDEELLDDLLYQIHINARIINKKFTHLKISLILLGISVIPWLSAIYFSKIYLK